MPQNHMNLRDYIHHPKNLGDDGSAYSHNIMTACKKPPIGSIHQAKHQTPWFVKGGISHGEHYAIEAEILVGELARLFLGKQQPKYRLWKNTKKCFVACKQIPGFTNFNGQMTQDLIFHQELSGIPEALVTLILLGQDDLKKDNIGYDDQNRTVIFDFDATVFTAGSDEEEKRFFFNKDDILALPHITHYQPFNWLDTYFVGKRPPATSTSLADVMDTSYGNTQKFKTQKLQQCIKIFLLHKFGEELIKKIVSEKFQPRVLTVYKQQISKLSDCIRDLKTTADCKQQLAISYHLIPALNDAVSSFYIYGKESFQHPIRMIQEAHRMLLAL